VARWIEIKNSTNFLKDWLKKELFFSSHTKKNIKKNNAFFLSLRGLKKK
jgi:hypothetical protein